MLWDSSISNSLASEILALHTDLLNAHVSTICPPHAKECVRELAGGCVALCQYVALHLKVASGL